MYSASKQAFVSPMIVEAVKKRKSKNSKKLEQIQPKDKKEDVMMSDIKEKMNESNSDSE